LKQRLDALDALKMRERVYIGPQGIRWRRKAAIFSFPPNQGVGAMLERFVEHLERYLATPANPTSKCE